MKLVKIIFSPTGGTKNIVDSVADSYNLDSASIDLTDSKSEPIDLEIQSNDIVFIGVPSYGGRVPEVALNNLSKLKGNGAQTILVVSYGNRDYDDTLIELYDNAINYDFNPIAAITAISEHSLLPQYATERPDKKDIEELYKFGETIQNNLKETLYGLPGNRPYKKGMNLPLTPKATKNCTECRLCFDVCLVDAIDKYTLKADRSKCIACMRCVKQCPVNARKLNGVMTTIASLALKKEASKRKNNQLFNLIQEER